MSLVKLIPFSVALGSLVHVRNDPVADQVDGLHDLGVGRASRVGVPLPSDWRIGPTSLDQIG